jgi:CheY-like chemotaxis protein
MNGVLGMSELLLEMPLGDQQRRFGEVIRSSGEALMSLLNDILDYSKIEAGRMDLESVPFELRPLVEETVQLVAGRAQEQRLELHVDMSQDVPPVLVGDPARLRQMLLNLLVNAVKFTPRGEVEVKVGGTRHIAGKAAVAISVRDTGIGIDADELRRVFQPFTQANSGVARRFGGTGLGLAISRRIAQEMGGDVHVDSLPGVGSTFVITLNLPVGEPPAVPPPLAGREVLVVEAPGRHRELLVQQLQILGAACTVSSDLASALGARTISAGPPVDVMFVDRALCCPLSAAAGPDRATRTIALVEWGAFLSDEELAELGLATQVFKPASSRVLVEAVLGTTSVRPDQMPAEGAEIDGPLVLVVDDNVVNRRVAAHYLQRLGYQAIEAGSGQEALDRIESAPPALVLMDIEMPGMDGYETTRRLRDRESGPGRLPVIALTAHAMAGYRDAVIRAGMDDYLTKPIRRAQLAQAIEAALRRDVPIPA